MTVIASREVDKSAVERSIYDETPSEIMDVFEQLGLDNDADRLKIAQLAELPSDTEPALRWIQLRAI